MEERCSAIGIVRVRPRWIGAASQEQARDVLVPELDGRCQRSAKVRTGILNPLRIGVQDLRDVREVTERSGDGEVVRCAACDEPPGHAGVDRTGPAVAEASDQAPAQPPESVQPHRVVHPPRATPERDVDRFGVLRRVTGERLSSGAVTAVEISASIQQQRRDTPGTAEHSPVQRRGAQVILMVDDPGLRIQQRANLAETASLGGGVDRMVCCCGLGHRTPDFTPVMIRF